MGSLIILAIMFGALYVFMILPQQRRMKAHRELLSKLQEGDLVMTNGGIYGAIAEVEDDVVWLEVAPEVELKISKAMIADKAPDDTEGADEDEDEDAELAEQGDEG